jgi:CHASE3 domain sensor protein
LVRRLIEYYIATGSGKYLRRVEEALDSMDDLLDFLDEKVGAGSS